MSIIGKTVIAYKQLGVVFGWSKEEGCSQYLRVRVWDTGTQSYCMKLALPNDLLEISDPLVIQLRNEDDVSGRRQFLEDAIEMALATFDEEWFDKLSAELADLREYDIEVGDVVTDLRGKNIGIVMTKPDAYKEVTMMVWNPGFRNYLEFDKRIDLIQKVRDPQILKSYNQSINGHDHRLSGLLREVGTELSLQTHDKEWYDDLNRKETSDGA